MSGPERLAIFEARDAAIAAAADAFAAGAFWNADLYAERAFALDRKLREEAARNGRSRK